VEEYLFNRLNFYADIYSESATASSLSSAEPATLSPKSFSYNTLNDSNVYLNQVVSTCSFLIECSYQATYFSDKSNDNIIDVSIKFGDVKEINDDVKEIACDVKEIVGDVKEIACDVKEIVGDVKEIACDVKETFGDVKEIACDVKETFGDVKESFGDVKESFGDVDFRPNKPKKQHVYLYIKCIQSSIYKVYLNNNLCVFSRLSDYSKYDINDLLSTIYKVFVSTIYITDTL
jgi:hypothetical protein